MMVITTFTIRGIILGGRGRRRELRLCQRLSLRKKLISKIRMRHMGRKGRRVQMAIGRSGIRAVVALTFSGKGRGCCKFIKAAGMLMGVPPDTILAVGGRKYES